MKPDSLWAVKKWCTICGSLLLLLPLGLPLYWGNMSIYAVSYIADHGGSKREVHTPWIISLYFLFNAVGLYIAGVMSNKLQVRKRQILACGITTFLSGIFSTYFCVKKSATLVTITLGFIAGVGGGIINGTALQYAVAWADKDLGFVTAFVQSGYYGGSVLINPLITMYVNPGNESPDIDMGPTKLFSQRQVLDQVPSFFLTFGFICSASQLFGLVLVREFPSKEDSTKGVITNEESTRTVNSKESQSDPAEIKSQELSQMMFNGVSQHSNGLSQNSNGLSQKSNVLSGEDKDDKGPSGMLKTCSFYTLWLALMVYDNAMLVVVNYYKQYGETRIEDDQFLTFLGTVLTLTTMLAIPPSGHLTDRFGVKKTLICMYSVSSVFCVFMYFTPMFNRWIYAANIVILGAFLLPIYSVLIITTCKLFGKTHYSSNLGTVASLSLLVNFINPVIFKCIVDFGWFYTFCYAGCLAAVGLIIIIIALPDA